MVVLGDWIAWILISLQLEQRLLVPYRRVPLQDVFIIVPFDEGFFDASTGRNGYRHITQLIAASLSERSKNGFAITGRWLVIVTLQDLHVLRASCGGRAARGRGGRGGPH